jgi:hypothetical protein
LVSHTFIVALHRIFGAFSRSDTPTRTSSIEKFMRQLRQNALLEGKCFSEAGCVAKVIRSERGFNEVFVTRCIPRVPRLKCTTGSIIISMPRGRDFTAHLNPHRAIVGRMGENSIHSALQSYEIWTRFDNRFALRVEEAEISCATTVVFSAWLTLLPSFFSF